MPFSSIWGALVGSTQSSAADTSRQQTTSAPTRNNSNGIRTVELRQNQEPPIMISTPSRTFAEEQRRVYRELEESIMRVHEALLNEDRLLVEKEQIIPREDVEYVEEGHNYSNYADFCKKSLTKT